MFAFSFFLAALIVSRRVSSQATSLLLFILALGGGLFNYNIQVYFSCTVVRVSGRHSRGLLYQLENFRYSELIDCIHASVRHERDGAHRAEGVCLHFVALPSDSLQAHA